MKCIFWNIRGIGNLETQLHLIQLIDTHKPDFLFLSEPMVTFDSVPLWVWHKLHFNKHAVNNRNHKLPNIWCLWNSSSDPLIIFNSAQCMAFSCVIEGVTIYIAVIYASTFYIKRRTL